MTDFMIDIETLGNRSNAAVVQIGVTEFDRTKGVGETLTLKVKPHPKSEMDFSTVQWWMGQSEVARKSVFEGAFLEPEDALQQLTAFLRKYGDRGLTMWSKPSTFDLVILESLYRNCGMEHPWPHWKTRDLRTLIEVADLNSEDQAVPTIPHDAGWDAHAQAITAIRCFDKLKDKNLVIPQTN